MGDALPKHDDDRDEAAHRRGEALVAKLRALGLTDADLAADDAVEASESDLIAWMGGRAPCPMPGV